MPAMRLIGTLPTEADSKRFCDYLLTRSIASHSERGSVDWQIWIEHDDQLDQGKAELEQYRQQPSDARYDAANQAKQLRAEAEKAAVRRRRNFRDMRTANFHLGKPSPVTVTIIFAAIVLAGLMHFDPGGVLFTDPNSLVGRLYAALLFDDPTKYVDSDLGRWNMFTSVAHGEIWRLVTPIFIHYGLMHLVFNMMWMYDLGTRIEPARGGTRMVIMIAIIAVISCSAEALWVALSPANTAHYTYFGGMSGVVAGLFGYAWMCGYFRPYEKIGVTQYETGLMLGWLVICTFGFVGPIANAAHWGGLITGMAMGAAPSLMRKMKI